MILTNKVMAALKMVSVIVVVCMLVAAPMTAQAITCGQVARALSPCVNYLKTTGAVPPRPCCNGVRAINAAARTTADRRTACQCLKSAAGSIKGIKQPTADALPRKCGVNIPYKISFSTNCAK